MWFWMQLASVLCWAEANVLDSLLVQRYRRSPIALMWNQAYFSLIVLAIIAFTMNLHSSWIMPLIVVGIIGYAGDLVFFSALKRIDVSVTNIAWVILSVILSTTGFLWFGESWSVTQTSGVLLVFIAIMILSLWHRRTSSGLSLLLLPALALLYTPFYLVQKAALLGGDGVVQVFFWSVLGRECMSFFFPFFVPAFRRDVTNAMREGDLRFFIINAAVIGVFFLATFMTTAAFFAGPISLVSVVGNVQPLFVLLLAGLTIRFFPTFAPRELLDARSLAMKTSCFLMAFLGLALLVIGG